MDVNKIGIASLNYAMELERLINKATGRQDHIQAEIRANPYQYLETTAEYLMIQQEAKKEEIVDFISSCHGMKGHSIDSLIGKGFDVGEIILNFENLIL